MNIQVDPHSQEPVYSQIISQIRGLIIDGLLSAGTKLPSVRELAKQLGVSVTTIHTAYDNLAAESLIETRLGSGTFVTRNPGAATGANLRTREEIDYDIENIPLMRWDPYGFNSEFFLVPPVQKMQAR